MRGRGPEMLREATTAWEGPKIGAAMQRPSSSFSRCRRPALDADALDFDDEFIGRGEGAGGECGHAEGFGNAADFLIGQSGQENFAEGGGVGVPAIADLRRHAHGEGAFDRVDDENFAAVEHAEVEGLFAGGDECFHLGGGRFE